MIPRGLLCALLALAARRELAAQIRGAESCAPEIVFNQNRGIVGANNLDRMHPLIARGRYASFVEHEDWAGALLAMRDDAAQAFSTAGVDSAVRVKFFAQVDTTVVAVRRLPPPDDSARSRYVDIVVNPARFQPLRGVSSYTLFRFASQIPVGDLPRSQADAVCWSALNAGLILFRLKTPLEGAAISRLGRLANAWANYRNYGYTRQPIEMLIWRGNARDSLPPALQGLVAHLSAGMEFSGGSIDSIHATTATVVEFGALRYWRNYTQYSGLSAIVAVASGRTVGAGPLVHFARGLRAGYVFRMQSGSVRRTLLLSADVLGLLERSRPFAEEGLSLARGKAILPSEIER